MEKSYSDNVQFGELQFSEWAELAQSDPAAFEAARRKTLQAYIDKTTNPALAAQLQVELDMQRICASSQPRLMEITSLQLETVLVGMTRLSVEADRLLRTLSNKLDDK